MTRSAALRDFLLAVLACLALLWLIASRNGARTAQEPPQPAANPAVAATPLPAVSVDPGASGEVGTALLGGYATWYEDPRHPRGLYAAAGSDLREMIGPDWRGTVIEVQGPGGLSVVVVLSDWCACGERHGLPTVLDLSRDAFAELADPSVGIVAVSVEIGNQLPRTDVSDPDQRMRLEVREDGVYR